MRRRRSVLAAAYGAGLVDMEAAAGCAACGDARDSVLLLQGRERRLLAIRFARFQSVYIRRTDSSRLARLLSFLYLFRPWHWPALIRMGENSKTGFAKAWHQGVCASTFSIERGHDQETEWLPKYQTLKARLLPGSREDSLRRCSAVVYRGINDMRVETVPVPAIGPGELLIKVATCGICGTDLKKIHMGSHAAPRIFGARDGRELSSRWARGSRKYSVGERVMTFHHHVPCGECYYCRKRTPAQCPLYLKDRRHGGVCALRRGLCRVHSGDGF
jgi:hypothetical protein